MNTQYFRLFFAFAILLLSHYKNLSYSAENIPEEVILQYKNNINLGIRESIFAKWDKFIAEKAVKNRENINGNTPIDLNIGIFECINVVKLSPYSNALVQEFTNSVVDQGDGQIEILDMIDASIFSFRGSNYFENDYAKINAAAHENDNYISQCGLRAVNVVDTWDALPTNDSTVTVAVLDSGVNLNHPDLIESLRDVNGKPIEGLDFVPPIDSHPEDEILEMERDDENNCIVPDAWRKRSYGHGTHVAGIIAARANKVGLVGMWGDYRNGKNHIKLQPVRIISENDEITQGILTASNAICWTRKSMAKARVHNYSFRVAGTETKIEKFSFNDGVPSLNSKLWAGLQYLRKTIESGADEFLAVVASGNDRIDVTPCTNDLRKRKRNEPVRCEGYSEHTDLEGVAVIKKRFPAGFDLLPNVVSVAAQDSRDANACELEKSILSSVSNRWAVDIAAPGHKTLSTNKPSNDESRYSSYYYEVCKNQKLGFHWTGTSFAAPHVSGAAALCIKSCNSIKPAGVKTALRCSSRKEGYDTRWGYLDAGALVNMCGDYCGNLSEINAANWKDYADKKCAEIL